MKDRSDDDDLFSHRPLPFQSHSKPSRSGAKRPRAKRVLAQEKWTYETLQSVSGLSDWQLWKLAEPTGLFDKLSSMRRARIGLVWVSRSIGATPYHPVEDSGLEITDPASGVACAIWQMKQLYRSVSYEQWLERYKTLAHERH
jgi:hypothetical protein